MSFRLRPDQLYETPFDLSPIRIIRSTLPLKEEEEEEEEEEEKEKEKAKEKEKEEEEIRPVNYKGPYSHLD